MIRMRPARSEDAPSLIAVAGSSATSARWSESEYRKLLQGSPEARLVALVIEDEGEVLGFLTGRQLTPDGAEWEIESLAVSSTARRRGLGSRLLAAFLDQARARGARDIFLEVRASNHAARRLYDKWAFVEAGVRKSYYQDPEEDALILRHSTVRRISN